MGSKSFADHLPHQKRGSEWIDQVMKWIIQVTDWTEWIEMKKVRLISGYVPSGSSDLLLTDRIAWRRQSKAQMR